MMSTSGPDMSQKSKKSVITHSSEYTMDQNSQLGFSSIDEVKNAAPIEIDETYDCDEPMMFIVDGNVLLSSEVTIDDEMKNEAPIEIEGTVEYFYENTIHIQKENDMLNTLTNVNEITNEAIIIDVINHLTKTYEHSDKYQCDMQCGLIIVSPNWLAKTSSLKMFR
ncbi:uncharacterized protein LOC126837817 isoform X5 [Adelges cooleyi]|uniref:uncharacterized protein LOC126837817 isoform X5 n=1 Tax=Adelges cooleyi TaxID=133065 RepID=UPI00217FC224|nr:uncharacterized protein LOC126837817 isoform X5 [Adelges cooleyi]XP_050427733.1 uncharacterized protein LOC126837817 isoform X5 [Adelges cooleyi]XP_050427734.1 uncharacterized protein LOC126837817 isoform X5 [Adelges cooleyi]XP_050427735.1 uncharacterized protein LOC126837817 isoform X5 [Adelges cooleyi]XP_050427736.1 uncharacterized protein LOC126837817 isoform X5 [Adelges cooleyi]